MIRSMMRLMWAAIAFIVAAAWTYLVVITLLVSDWLIWLMLFTRSDERRIRPTKRPTSWPKGVKRELLRRQDYVCVYCGHRRISRSFEIEHMTPVTRGGSNDMDNLQGICRPCNKRKGVLTDGEFRTRYARLVPATPLTPPPSPVSQAEFTDETRRTSQPAAVKKFRRQRFISPRKKVVTGSFACGIATFLAVLVGLALAGAGGFLLSLPAVIGGGCVGLGLLLRAHATGVMDVGD